MALIRPKNIPTANLSDGTSFLQSVGVTDLPAGSVVQVAYDINTSPPAVSINSNTYTDSGLLTVSITPQKANSKIVIYFGGYVLHQNVQASNYGGGIDIFRSVAGGGYTSVSGGKTLDGNYRNAQTTDHWQDNISSVQFVDSPSYTLGQSISYQLWLRKASRSTGGYYIQHTGGVIGGNGTNVTGHIRGILYEVAV